MWCITFSFILLHHGTVFGLTVVAHFVLILAIVVTVALLLQQQKELYRFKDWISFC